MKYTLEEKQFIIDNWNTNSLDNLTKLFNQKFNHNLNVSTFRVLGNRLGCKRTKEAHRFAYSLTRSAPIGTIRFNKYHICIKIANNNNSYSHNWKRICPNKYLYELEHNDKVLNDECVIIIHNKLYKIKTKHFLQITRMNLYDKGLLTEAMLEILKTIEEVKKYE